MTLPDALFRIRTRLLVANGLLVILPVAGLAFARTFERELLRSEEEGLVAVAVTLAAEVAAGGSAAPAMAAAATKALATVAPEPLGTTSLTPTTTPTTTTTTTTTTTPTTTTPTTTTTTTTPTTTTTTTTPTSATKPTGASTTASATASSGSTTNAWGPGARWTPPQGSEAATATAEARTAEAAAAAARRLGAQVRLLDAEGRAVVDSGPEAVEKVTAGRALLPRSETPSPITVGDPSPPDGSFASRPEVRRALDGKPGRATRISDRLRSVRLFVAEPIRNKDGQVQGAVYLSRTTYPVLVSLYRIRNGLVRVVAVSMLIALGVGLYLALTISRPLAKLTAAAKRIAGGERGVALKLSGRDEVAELARAFDHMARELDARLGYVSELAANVSHEFKTPIASIRGAAELLRDGAADDPAARDRFLANILDDAERLNRLVTRLLELSRIEAHQHDRREPLDVRALIDEVVERHDAADHPVSVDYQAQASFALGDAERLASALGNLLDNAVRFGAPHPVRVRVLDAGDALRVEVIDQGPGVSPANLARVWDRFFTTSRDQGGTGLGLAIVKAAVEAHGGQVGASSEPGRGSTFWFTLPRRL